MTSKRALSEHKPFDAEPARTGETWLYPDDLLPALQRTLASLTDLEVRHEIERDYLEGWSGPDWVRRRFLAALDVGWQREREPIVARLCQLRALTQPATQPPVTASSQGSARERPLSATACR